MLLRSRHGSKRTAFPMYPRADDLSPNRLKQNRITFA